MVPASAPREGVELREAVWYSAPHKGAGETQHLYSLALNTLHEDRAICLPPHHIRLAIQKKPLAMAIHWIKKKLTTVGDKVKALKIRKPVLYHDPRRVPNPRQRRPPSPYPGAGPRSPRATRENPAPGIIRRRRSVALTSQMHALLFLAASDPELDDWLEDALPTHVDDTPDDRTIVGDSEGDEPPFVSRERYVARTTFRSGDPVLVAAASPSDPHRLLWTHAEVADLMEYPVRMEKGRCSYPAVYIQDDEPAITWFCPENFEILYDLLLSPDWHSR
ncbi:hypothetical protein BD413DRAFT_554360 [Trametes elegans]|nr:hypothetical protein BD413DRAFT_554360 [Trametes elegans]